MPTPRPHCSVFIATSVDGFIARTDGSIDFLDLVERPGEDYGFGEFFESVDTLVLGRVTYETALSFETWPYAGKRVVVLSRSGHPSIHGETFTHRAPGDLLAELGDEGSRRIYVDGGQAISSFLAEGLVDELTISVVPILLGDGIRLFRSGFGETRLTLGATDAYESGLVMLRYRRRG